MALNVDVCWVLQGSALSFTGFMVEFLGFSGGFRKYLPNLKLVFGAMPLDVSDNDMVVKANELIPGLFPSESDHLLWSLSSNASTWDLSTLKAPNSPSFGVTYTLPSTMNHSLFCTKDSFLPNKWYLGNNLMKYKGTHSLDASECCTACYYQPLCIAWSYSSFDGCHLKGSIPTGTATNNHHGTEHTSTTDSVGKNESPGEYTSGNMLHRKISEGGRIPLPKVVIFHGTMCKIDRDQSISMGQHQRDPNHIYIGRFMTERDDFDSKTGMTIDELSLTMCMKDMDEIWVPTEWHKKVFQMLSKRLSLTHVEIAVIPETVDTTLFAPNHRYPNNAYPGDGDCGVGIGDDSCTSQFTSDNSTDSAGVVVDDGCRWMDGWEGVRGGDSNTAGSSSRTAGSSHGEEEGKGLCRDDDIVTCTSQISSSSSSTSSSSSGKTLHLTPKEKRRFVFYSSFKWEYRKGWDLLLDAYWSVFLPTDAVVLLLQTYIPMFLRQQWRPNQGLDKEAFSSSADQEGDVMEKIRRYAMIKYNKTLDQLPAVEWVVCPKEQALNFSFCESMRTRVVEHGVPLLTRPQVRDWLASANAFVLPTRGEGWGLPIAEAMALALPVIVTNHSGPAAYATESSAYLIPVLDGVTDEKGFAIPDVEILRHHLRQVVVDSVPQGIAHSKGQKARHLMQQLNSDVVAQMVVERIKFHTERRGWIL